MAINCDLNTLLQESTCFLDPCLGPDDRDSILLYLMIKNLAASGGTDYSSNLTGLLSAAKQWQIINERQRDAVSLRISLENATNNGASFTSTVSALKTAAKCVSCIGTDFRKSVILYLNCAISNLGKPS